MGFPGGHLGDPCRRIEILRLFSGERARDRQISSPDQTENRKQLKQFRIGKRRIHFGKVLQGEVIWDKIPYKNESAIEIGVRVSEAPSWIALDRSHFVIGPGGEGALLLGVFTERLEGEIKGALTLEMSHGGVSRTQTVPVLGSVRMPLGIIPGRLVLVPGAAHEVRLYNDTQDAVRIAEIRMPADFLVSEWAAGSAQIGPGSHSILKVRWDTRPRRRRVGVEASSGCVWPGPWAGRRNSRFRSCRRLP